MDRGGIASSGDLGGARPSTQPADRPGTGDRPERPSTGDRPSQGERQQDRQDTAGQRQEDRQANQDANREDWQNNQKERREDWQDYADDHYEEYGHGYYYGGYYHPYDNDAWVAFAAGAVLATGVAITASTMAKSSCTMTSISFRGDAYYRCGSNWYQKGMQGTDVVYIVVQAPPGY